MITKDEYHAWPPHRLTDPRGATVAQFIHGMTAIVAAEGPVMASRVFNIFARASGLSRIHEATRKGFIAALRRALAEGVLVAEKEASEDPASWILRLPPQKAMHLRTLGSRSLHEVPGAELAEIMLEIRAQNDLISKEELFRSVLAGYGLIRLTEATTSRLDYGLKTWF